VHLSVALTRSQDRPAARRAPAFCKSGGEVSGGDESSLLEERDPRAPQPARCSAPRSASPAPGAPRDPRAPHSARRARRARRAPRQRVAAAGGGRPSCSARRARLARSTPHPRPPLAPRALCPALCPAHPAPWRPLLEERDPRTPRPARRCAPRQWASAPRDTAPRAPRPGRSGYSF